jgi:hypothetical protein
MITFCRSTLKTRNYPSRPPILTLPGLWGERAYLRNAHEAWYAERDHNLTFVLAIGAFISGVMITIRSGHSDDFARNGAIITLIGLISSFYGIKHRITLSNPSVSKIQIHSISEADKAELLSWKSVAFVTVAGTMIWAYGDIFLEKILWPLFDPPLLAQELKRNPHIWDKPPQEGIEQVRIEEPVIFESGTAIRLPNTSYTLEMDPALRQQQWYSRNREKGRE